MAQVLEAQTYYTTQEAAGALELTDGRIRQMLRAGEIVARKLGKHGWAIPSSEIERLRRQRGLTPNP